MASSARRPDFTAGLLHMTKPRTQRRRHFERLQPGQQDLPEQIPAFEVLKEILRDGKIVASGNKIKGSIPVVCLTEMPLSALSYFANRNGTHGMYSMYGISISKQTGYAAGARPVIYIPDSESGWVPPDERWRLMRFENHVDFTHEREWRTRGDLRFAGGGIYVLVWNSQEAREILAMDLELPICGALPMEDLAQML